MTTDGNLSDNEQTKKDEAYSPSSDRETAAMQGQAPAESDAIDPDIDASLITALPGTGGADDAGDIDEPDDYSRDGTATPRS